MYKADETIRMARIDRHPSRYLYLITKGSTSWCAFNTKQGLRTFLHDYGLTVHYNGRRGRDSRWGRIASFTLVGNFEVNMMMNKWQWDAIREDWVSWRLSNGQRTLWKIQCHENGRSLFYLNPNVKDRPVFPYFHD